MKKLLALLLSGCLALSLVACGGGDSESQSDAGADGDGALKVLLVASQLGDKSFNDSANEGLEKAAADYGIDYSFREIGSEAEKVAPSLTDFSEEGYDIMVFNNLGFGSAAAWLESNAANYPDTLYLVYDEVDPDNVTTVDDDLDVKNVQYLKYRASQSDFIAGYLAAKLSESGSIGFVGGQEAPVIYDFLAGYVQGAQYANPNVKINVSYVGGYTDAAKGKDLGLTQIRGGADVIHAVAGSAGNGAIEAASEQGVLAIGVDSDQYTVFKEEGNPLADVVVTSSLKNVGESLYTVIGEVVDGTFEKTAERWFGAEEGCTGIAKTEKYDELVSEELRTEVEGIEAGLADGSIECKSYFDMSEDEWNDLLSTLNVSASEAEAE